MQDSELQELRRDLASNRGGRGIYYPDGLRERVSAWAYRRRDQGATWPVIGTEIGVNGSTLRRWVQDEGRRRRKNEKPTMALVPVKVVDTPTTSTTRREPHRISTALESCLALVSPSGFRIEGLTLDDAIAALERLG